MEVLLPALRMTAPRLPAFAQPFTRLFGFALLLSLAIGSSASAQTQGVWRTYLYANEVNDLTAVGEDIYAATSGGLVRLRPGAALEQWSRAPGGLSSDTLRAVATAPNGEVWIATPHSGISIFNPESEDFEPYTSLLEPIPGDRIRSIRFRSVKEVVQGVERSFEHTLIGAEQGYAVLRDGELRFVCLQGVDLCDLSSFDIRDLEERNDTEDATGPRTLWLATANGVIAQTSTGTWEPRSDGLASLDVQKIFAGRAIAAGSVYLWNGTSWGLDETGLPDDFVARDLGGIEGGSLYVAGSQGVFQRTGTTWTRVGTNAINATSIAVTESGRLFAGAADGLERQDGIWEWTGTTWVQHRLDGPSLRQNYRSLFFAEDGALWMSHAQSGTRPQVLRLDRGAWTFFQGGLTGCAGAFTFQTFPLGNYVYLAHCCCGTDANCPLERINAQNDQCELFGSVGNAWDFDRDDAGNLWIATWNEGNGNAHGFFRLDARDSTWINIRVGEGSPLLANQISAIRAIGNELWIGYAEDGVHRIDLGDDHLPGTPDDVWTHYTKTDSNRPLIGDQVTRIEEGFDGRVWIGTTSGVSIWRTPRFTNVGAAFNRLPTAAVNEIVPLADGGAWVATKEGGLTRMTPRAQGGFTYETFSAPYIPHPNVDGLALSPDGRTLWIGTTRGLASFTPLAVASSADKIGAYPNPLVLGCTDGIRVAGAGGTVSGVVVDLSGKILHRIEQSDEGALLWDGRDADGPVTPGLYYLRLRTPRGVRSVGVGIVDGACSP